MACYLLLIRLPVEESIRVGQLGTFEFPAGFYIYVGRAKKNLASRIRRHVRKEKRLHWHIDYFLTRSAVEGVLIVAGDDECGVAHFLSSHSFLRAPVMGFGSSDCRCRSHFFLLETDPGWSWNELTKKLSVSEFRTIKKGGY